MDIKHKTNVGVKMEEDQEDTKMTSAAPPSSPNTRHRSPALDPLHIFDDPPPKGRMSSTSSASSSSSTPQSSSFSQIAAHYRLFMLEDLLAEPQEMAYDPYREVIYVSQRCLQGHAASPVEYSTHLSVFDASPNSATQGSFIASIDIRPYCGPHGLEMDEGGAYLYVDVENDSQGAKGTITVDLGTQTVVGFTAASGQGPSTGDGSDFIAEVCLRKGKVLRKIMVPNSERRNNTNVGTGRHVNFSTPGIRFGGKSNDKGLHVLDPSDPVVSILRHVLGSGSIYVLSKDVLLI
ncbi:hypothetical protein GQ53DRAFT_824627 [Thozetella sp. PMI_491]|nr:hypothetical protein GQ53DRAFT_824627 [Thozetella sp. PMI_491]